MPDKPNWNDLPPLDYSKGKQETGPRAARDQTRYFPPGATIMNTNEKTGSVTAYVVKMGPPIGPVEILHPAFAAAQSVLNAKSDDYGASDNSKRKYFPFDDESYATMMHTKMERIMNLIRKKRDGRQTNFESLKDSVGDIINYAAFYWSYLDEMENATDAQKQSANSAPAADGD
jgi:hypothetical protein